MNDTTLAKVITDNLKIVAFRRVIRPTEFTDGVTIFRLTDFTASAEDKDFDDEASLLKAFKEKVAQGL